MMLREKLSTTAKLSTTEDTEDTEVQSFFRANCKQLRVLRVLCGV
jgi:hypothetical protein